MFGFKKNNHPSTIVIDGSDVITDDQLAITSIWQQRHVPSNIGAVLAKAVNVSDDALDIALTAYIHAHGMSMPLYEPFHRIVFARQSGISGNVWHHGSDYQIAVKGMPERIIEHCDMSENERESITTQLHAMSATGTIVIAVATGILQHSIKNLNDLKKNDKLSFVGFISLQVNVSSEARQLITQAKAHNITIYLCTGQHHVTTYYLAQQLGIASRLGDVFDTQRMSMMNTDDIHAVVVSTKIFSRCEPEYKKRILPAIRATDSTMITIDSLADLKKLLAN